MTKPDLQQLHPYPFKWALITAAVIFPYAWLLGKLNAEVTTYGWIGAMGAAQAAISVFAFIPWVLLYIPFRWRFQHTSLMMNYVRLAIVLAGALYATLPNVEATGLFGLIPALIVGIDLLLTQFSAPLRRWDFLAAALTPMLLLVGRYTTSHTIAVFGALALLLSLHWSTLLVGLVLALWKGHITLGTELLNLGLDTGYAPLTEVSLSWYHLWFAAVGLNILGTLLPRFAALLHPKH